jgi:hypothetical protein
MTQTQQVYQDEIDDAIRAEALALHDIIDYAENWLTPLQKANINSLLIPYKAASWKRGFYEGAQVVHRAAERVIIPAAENA